MHSWKRWWPAASNPAARRAAPAAHRDQAASAGGLVLAGLALYWRRIPLLRRSAGSDLVLAGPIQRFQSGVVNDYVTGIVIGLTCLGGALAFSIR